LQLIKCVVTRTSFINSNQLFISSSKVIKGLFNKRRMINCYSLATFAQANTLFYKNTRFIFAKNYLRTNSSKCRTIRKVHFASWLYTYNCSSQLQEHKQKLHITDWTSWHNCIFGYKLRTD